MNRQYYGLSTINDNEEKYLVKSTTALQRVRNVKTVKNITTSKWVDIHSEIQGTSGSFENVHSTRNTGDAPERITSCSSDILVDIGTIHKTNFGSKTKNFNVIKMCLIIVFDRVFMSVKIIVCFFYLCIFLSHSFTIVNLQIRGSLFRFLSVSQYYYRSLLQRLNIDSMNDVELLNFWFVKMWNGMNKNSTWLGKKNNVVSKNLPELGPVHSLGNAAGNICEP